MTTLYPDDESLVRITSVLNLTLNYNYQKWGKVKEKKKLESNKNLMINPFQPCVTFIYALKTSENLKVF